MLMLRLGAKSSTDQTYDEDEMSCIGREFDPKPASSALFTGLVRGS